MKCKYAVLLLSVLCIIFCGCRADNHRNTTIKFHYIEASAPYNSISNSIVTESKNIDIQSLQIEEILKLYLSGPKSEKYASPFPPNTELVYVSVSENTAQIIFNSEFAQLTGSDLMVACACVCLTMQEISNYHSVEISAIDSLLDGQPYITMDANSIYTHDTFH